MKSIRWIALICVLLLLAYGASPYISFWRFSNAIKSGDSEAIGSHVDFPAVRASLKKQLVARFATKNTGRNRWINLGPSLIDAIVDAYVTPDGIAALLSHPDALKNLQNPGQFHFTTGRDGNSLKVKYAFFTGPRSFVVDRDGMKLTFRFADLSWKLNNIDLALGARKP